MAENHVWSASFGRWFGIPVRIHALLILFVALIFGIEWHYQHLLGTASQGTATVTLLVLLSSIVVHELAHLFALFNLGGYCRSMVLMPWGGNSDFATHDSGKARAVIHLAGPFVNGVIFLLGALVLSRHWQADLVSLVNPFRPHAFHAGDWEHSLLGIVTWVNFQLMLVNLIPCFPFDGAAVIRSVIDLLDVDIPVHRSESAVLAMGHAAAFTLIGMSWLLRDSEFGALQPAWFILLIAGISLIFAARYSWYRQTIFEDADWDDLDDGSFDIEYGTPFDGDEDERAFLEISDKLAMEKELPWLMDEDESFQHGDSAVEAEEEKLADEILIKLHGRSVDCLSESERSLLIRVSERIRRRRAQEVN